MDKRVTGRFNERYPPAAGGETAPGGLRPRAYDSPWGEPTEVLKRRALGWELGLPPYASPDRSRPMPAIIAVGGGKGGVGKSLASASLAARIAMGGRKVLAVDLDVGGANLHTYFGLPAAAHNLADVIVYGSKSFRDVVRPTPLADVFLVSGGREEAWGGMQSLRQNSLKILADSLFSAKSELDVDCVVLDLGAGTHPHTVDFFSLAHLGIATVLPEPTSIENAYLFLKTVLFRLIENVGVRGDSAETASEIIDCLLHDKLSGTRGGGQAIGYAEKLSELAALYPGLVTQIRRALGGRVLGLAVNQIRSQREIDIGKSMEIIGKRYFGFQTRYCGYVNYDEAALKALQGRRLLVRDFPQSIISRRFGALARAVVTELGY